VTELYLGLMFIGIVMTVTGWFMMRADRSPRAGD